jgi:hypothetical protein
LPSFFVNLSEIAIVCFDWTKERGGRENFRRRFDERRIYPVAQKYPLDRESRRFQSMSRFTTAKKSFLRAAPSGLYFLSLVIPGAIARHESSSALLPPIVRSALRSA